MDFAPVNQLVRTLLYEGYMLYPYRASALKNSKPFNLGSLYPKKYCEAHGETDTWFMQVECLAREDNNATLQGCVHFLQGRNIQREVIVPESELDELAERPAHVSFSFPEDGPDRLRGSVELLAERTAVGVFKVRIRIVNETPAAGADCILFSTHAILGICGGRFLSSIDPPQHVRELVEGCKNRGAWPVLVGDPNQHNMVLAAPIILYDFPQIAPESADNLFDATEIDELLTLRILTLTDVEKDAMRADDQTRTLLERVEASSAHQLLALHGARRRPNSGHLVRPGDRVIIRPQGQTDVLDLALQGKTATVASIEEDFEGQVFYCLTLDDDPGRDLGTEGKPGHRFFFRRDELEFVVGGP